MTSGCDQVDRGYSMEARPFPDRRFSERSHLALSGVLSTLCPHQRHDADGGIEGEPGLNCRLGHFRYLTVRACRFLNALIVPKLPVTGSVCAKGCSRVERAKGRVASLDWRSKAAQTGATVPFINENQLRQA